MQQPTAKARSTTRNRIDDWTDSCGSVTIPAIAVQSIADLSEEPDSDHLKAAKIGTEVHVPPPPYLRDKREKCEAGGHVQNLYHQRSNTSSCACGMMQHAGVPDSIVPPAHGSVYLVTVGRKLSLDRTLLSPNAYNRFEDAMAKVDEFTRESMWSEFVSERPGVVREWRAPDGRAIWIEQLLLVDRYLSAQCST